MDRKVTGRRLVRVPVTELEARRLRVGHQLVLERQGGFVLSLVVAVELQGGELEVTPLHEGDATALRLRPDEPVEVLL